jgi:hypothetical protein
MKAHDFTRGPGHYCSHGFHVSATGILRSLLRTCVPGLVRFRRVPELVQIHEESAFRLFGDTRERRPLRQMIRALSVSYFLPNAPLKVR